MVGRKRALQQVFEIGALTVLHIIDMPSPRRGPLDPRGQVEEPARRIDVPWLRGHDENGVDPLHRHHPDEPGERPLALRLQHRLEFAGELGRIAFANREHRIGLAGQKIGVEGADQADQRLPDRCIATDQQRIARVVAGDLAALGDIGFEDLGEILRRGVAHRYHLGAGADGGGAADRVGGGADRDRHDRIDPVLLDQGCAVLVEQGFERRQQGRARQRGAGFDRTGAMDAGVDRVAHLQGRAEDRARDHADIGIDEIESDVAALARDPGGGRRPGRDRPRRRRVRCRRRLAALHKGALLVQIGRNGPADSRCRRLQGSRLFERHQPGGRRLAGGQEAPPPASRRAAARCRCDRLIAASAAASVRAPASRPAVRAAGSRPPVPPGPADPARGRRRQAAAAAAAAGAAAHPPQPQERGSDRIWAPRSWCRPGRSTTPRAA